MASFTRAWLTKSSTTSPDTLYFSQEAALHKGVGLRWSSAHALNAQGLPWLAPFALQSQQRLEQPGACSELGQLVTAPMGLVRAKWAALCSLPMPPPQGLLGQGKKTATLS